VSQASVSSILLGYLDQLYRAAIGRDAPRVRELLEHALASQLPGEVRAEALSIVAAPASSLRAPIRMLQFRQRIVQLDQEVPDEDDPQLEFEFPARRRAPASYASDD
jgi:hypothetical protein